jgi:hypothetical protein
MIGHAAKPQHHPQHFHAGVCQGFEAGLEATILMEVGAQVVPAVDVAGSAQTGAWHTGAK